MSLFQASNELQIIPQPVTSKRTLNELLTSYQYVLMCDTCESETSDIESSSELSEFESQTPEFEYKSFRFRSKSEENNNNPESKKLKWGTIIPRIGGITFGCCYSSGISFIFVIR